MSVAAVMLGLALLDGCVGAASDKATTGETGTPTTITEPDYGVTYTDYLDYSDADTDTDADSDTDTDTDADSDSGVDTGVTGGTGTTTTTTTGGSGTTPEPLYGVTTTATVRGPVGAPPRTAR
ncbi:MAG: hypothetical protein ABMB14_06025 [Myxococcota bacterium]